MTDQHRATPEQWEHVEKFVKDCGYDSCIIELRDRITALEAGQTCPHIVSSDEGTNYCALAEQTANQFRDATKMVAAAAPTEPLMAVRRQPLQCPSPATIAECGGPCESGFEHCDCGLLEQLNPPLRPTQHSADSLVERVRSVLASADSASARAAIREVARWLRSELVSRAVADRLEQEA
jgi:hypothetical protein